MSSFTSTTPIWT